MEKKNSVYLQSFGLFIRSYLSLRRVDLMLVNSYETLSSPISVYSLFLIWEDFFFCFDWHTSSCRSSAPHWRHLFCPRLRGDQNSVRSVSNVAVAGIDKIKTEQQQPDNMLHSQGDPWVQALTLHKSKGHVTYMYSTEFVFNNSPEKLFEVTMETLLIA